MGLRGNQFEMVQLMEAWFLADPEAVGSWYGKGFRPWADRRDIEAVPSVDVKQQLKAATRDTKKREYHKTRHAPALLAAIDSRKVQERAAHCRRFFDALAAAVVAVRLSDRAG